MGTPGVLWSMARLSGNRPRIGRRGAVVVHDEEHITVIADEPMPFQVDGDALDLRDKVSFRSVPAAPYRSSSGLTDTDLKRLQSTLSTAPHHVAYRRPESVKSASLG